MSQTKRLKMASGILDRVGMQEREYFLPSQLSGGQVQSVAIARALVNNPRLIIADEPTGNLDSNGSRLVMELLSEIHKMGNTILFVTHNPELTRYASRVIYMHDGQIIADEATAIGRVAPRARRGMLKVAEMTEEDDLAGVSALMKAKPHKDTKPVRKRKAPAKPRHTTVKKRKTPKKAAKT
jgi:putative ABC transport system ATP-binding protein